MMKILRRIVMLGMSLLFSSLFPSFAFATTLITVEAVTADNIINGGEASRDINIKGSVADASKGDTVTITVNGVTYTGVVHTRIGQYVDEDGNTVEFEYLGFSLPVAGADLAADVSLTASVSGTDENGNPYQATVVHEYGTGVSSSGCMAMLCLLQKDADEDDCKGAMNELWHHLGNGGAMPGCKLVAFSDMEQTLRKMSYPEIPYQCPDPPLACPYPQYEGYIFDADLAVAMFRENMQGTSVPRIQVKHQYDDDGNLIQVTVSADGTVKKVISR